VGVWLGRLRDPFQRPTGGLFDVLSHRFGDPNGSAGTVRAALSCPAAFYPINRPKIAREMSLNRHAARRAEE
jgi:hypothetical protein